MMICLVLYFKPWSVKYIPSITCARISFVFTTLIHEPTSIVALLVILVLSVALDFGWKWVHANRTKSVQPGN